MLTRNIFSVRIPGLRSLYARPAAKAASDRAHVSVPESSGCLAIPDQTPSGQAKDIARPVCLGEAPMATPHEVAAEGREASQCPYRPLSRIPAGGALVPAVLAPHVQQALDAFSAGHGDPDAWLRDRLGWGAEEMASRLTAEQADAVMLALSASDAREGFILADATGFGKGRILWAVAVGLLRAGGRVVFLTETENLFSDAWRDIRQLDAEKLVGRPFILNAGARVVDLADPDAPSPLPVWRPSEVNAILSSGSVPADIRVVFATYSQFNRAKGQKADWLRSIAADCHLLLDEAHNMVGAGSNTNRLFQEVLPAARSVVFSSATFSRDIGNTAVYASVFPWLKPLLRQAGREVAREDIPAFIRRCLAQESVRLAVASGRLTRREADMSGVALEFRGNESRLPAREAFADAAAQVFGALSRIAAIARAAAERANGEAGRNGEQGRGRKSGQWTALPMGTVLAALTDQMEMALLVDDAVDEAKASLRRAEKPLIVVENTHETFLKDVLSGDGRREDDEDDENLFALNEDVASTLADGLAFFSDACSLAARRLATLTRRSGSGGEPERLVIDTREMRAALDRAEDVIKSLPRLNLSPIDDVRRRLEEDGWRVREISGRTSRVEKGKLVPWPGDDRNAAIAGFNHGEVDALILTRAGATGLSLHDSVEFRDRKRRRMIFLRMLRSPVKMVQMMGRVFRRGQASVPSFAVLCSGLPSENYGFAMQRRKLEELSAAVTGQPRGVAALDVPDPFNALGEKIAQEMMIDRPDIAQRLGIADEADDEIKQRRDETATVRRMFRRLPALPVALQKRLLDAFFVSYRERVEAGADPNGGEARLPGAWRVESETLIHTGDGSSCRVLGPPVRVVTLVGKKSFEPLRSDAVRRLLDATQARPDALQARADLILGFRQKALLAAAGGDAFTLDKALREPGENAVKALDGRLAGLVSLLRTLVPGIGAQLPDEEGRGREAVVLDVLLAPANRALSARDYRLVYAIPGERKPRRLGLDAIMSSKVSLFWDTRHGARVLAGFDQAAVGQAVERRMVVTGSLPRAALETLRIRSSAGVRVDWLDEDGRRLSGFLVPRDAEGMMPNLFVGVSAPYFMAKLVGHGAKIWSDSALYEGGLLVVPERAGVLVHWPEGRRDCSALSEAGLDWIRTEHANGFVPASSLERLCASVIQACGTVYCDVKWRGLLQSALHEPAQDIAPAPATMSLPLRMGSV